jgi:hypothetical protein
MAKVWFVRRRHAEWFVPGGVPAFEMPLASLVFKLDLGPQRWMGEVRLHLDPGLAPEDPAALDKVIVETTTQDVAAQPFSAFQVGCYDSPFPPAEAARRLSQG